MPASSSSLTVPVIGHLAELASEVAGESPRLLAVLAKITDPRRRRGVRHRLVVILGLAVCGVLAGARSFTAIAEWAADADRDTLRALGVTGTVPSESTFRRTLQRLDADAFDALAGEWAARRTAPDPKARQVIAVDGKTLRGSRHGGEDGPSPARRFRPQSWRGAGAGGGGRQDQRNPDVHPAAGPPGHRRRGHHR